MVVCFHCQIFGAILNGVPFLSLKTLLIIFGVTYCSCSGCLEIFQKVTFFFSFFFFYANGRICLLPVC